MLECKRYTEKAEFSFPERCEAGFTIVLPSYLEQTSSSEPMAHNSENWQLPGILIKRKKQLNFQYPTEI